MVLSVIVYIILFLPESQILVVVRGMCFIAVLSELKWRSFV